MVAFSSMLSILWHLIKYSFSDLYLSLWQDSFANWHNTDYPILGCPTKIAQNFARTKQWPQSNNQPATQSRRERRCLEKENKPKRAVRLPGSGRISPNKQGSCNSKLFLFFLSSIRYFRGYKSTNHVKSSLIWLENISVMSIFFSLNLHWGNLDTPQLFFLLK